LTDFFTSLEATPLATWVRQSPSIWAYPTILTLHTVGLGIVVGVSAVIDFRLLGAARRIRVASLAPLFPVIWWGFAVNATTGVLLFMSDASTKSHQTVFLVKLGLIALALVNTVLIRGTVRRAEGTGDSTAGSHRIAAVLSLLLWAGALTAGRLMAYASPV
jgi:hypothetical protein